MTSYSNQNFHNEYDDDSSDASMESESGSTNVSDVKCTLLPKSENENEAQHQIISKLANTKKNIYKIMQQKEIALASYVLFDISLEGCQNNTISNTHGRYQNDNGEKSKLKRS